jgi:hypothetical protein
VELKAYLNEWARRFDPRKKRLGKLAGLVEEMRKAAAGVNPVLFGAGAELTADKRRETNRLLLGIERDFAFPDGIPNRTWFKHLVFGTRSTYAALLVPELTEAAEAGNERGVTLAITHLEEALTRVISKLREIAGRLRQPGG